jgi:hypothetical protein
MTIVIDTVSEDGAWARAFDRGCLTDVVARCKGCGAVDCAHPDLIFAGIVPIIPVHDHTSPEVA